ncbi:class I SAM-dependent methyltransferase [Methylobacterium oryzisoli]
MRNISRKIGRLIGGGQPKFARQDYKQTWNSISGTEDAAKMAVGGHTDETLYKDTGLATKRMLEETVGVRPDDVILEIGAGVGRVGAVLAPVCRKWIGADVSAGMVRHMRHRLAAFPNAEPVEISGFDLAPVPDASVDMVYCTIVFMHLEEWDRYNYVREAYRVLKPGGRLYVDNVNQLTDAGWEVFEAHRAIPPQKRPPYISKTSTPQELINYLTRAGFDGIRNFDRERYVVVYGTKPQRHS